MFCAAINTNFYPAILMGIWQFLKNNPLKNETKYCVFWKQFLKLRRFRKNEKKIYKANSHPMLH